MLPEVGCSSRTKSRPSVVLPEPDSPTKPSTEPRGTARSTRFTTSRIAGRRNNDDERSG